MLLLEKTWCKMHFNLTGKKSDEGILLSRTFFILLESLFYKK